MACPLCRSTGARPSWVGTTTFRDKEFRYLECVECGSLYCDPMPDGDDLAVMYDRSYVQGSKDDSDFGEPKDTARVVEVLEGREPGTFLDYGCGEGELLLRARELGWKPLGVELSPEVVATLRAKTSLSILEPSELHATKETADVLHLGDVLEHLTALDEQMPRILKLLKPGGILLAQGPLEAQANLFTWTVSAQRRLRRAASLETPPYHVLLATAKGQRTLFERFGLRQIEFSVHETAWPAPARWSARLLQERRALALFLLRKASQAITACSPGPMGNRYFYAGSVLPPGPACLS